MLGLAFKENCPDLRNSKVIDVIRELSKFGAKVDVYDPWVDAAEARARIRTPPDQEAQSRASYDAVVLAVGHDEFKDMGVAQDPPLRQSGCTCSTTSSMCSPRDQTSTGAC